MSIRILLLDIETAPNTVFAWSLWEPYLSIDKIIQAGYTLCWSAKWLGKKEVMFDSLHQNTELGMLKGIYDLIGEADAVVHYNGSSFDMPTLNKEFVTHGMKPPSPHANIDLLTTMKRVFRFPSNKLAYVAPAMELGNKIETKGMDLWKGCMDGDDASWALMERYNKQDVRLLEKLYDKLLPWIPNHPNVAIYNYDGRDLHCTRCDSKILRREGFYHTKTGIYQRFQCKDCGKWLRGRTTVRPPERKQPLLVDARVS